MTWFDSLKMKVYRDLSKSEPSMFDWFALGGLALTLLVTTISVVLYLACDANDRETVFLAKHMSLFVKYLAMSTQSVAEKFISLKI